MPDSKANADVLNPKMVKNNVIFFKILLLKLRTYILKKHLFILMTLLRLLIYLKTIKKATPKSGF
jgi:hypothetical protein